MRSILAAVLIVAATALPASAVSCAELGLLDQSDLAGIYVDPSIPMRVQVYPCSGVRVLWDNPYGRHEAYYSMTVRVESGGVIGHGHTPDPRVGYLDNAYTIGVKPAEVGFVQIITVSPYGEIVGVYRLPKMPA